MKGVQVTWDGSELDFSMTMGGLLELLGCFREVANGTYQLDIPSAERTDLCAIEIRHGEGRLKVSLEGGRVLFTGGEKAMSLLADNMDGLLSSWAAGCDQHFHFDPSSDQLLLEPDSEAFILSPFS